MTPPSGHPAVAMWHVGNEFGQACFCDRCAERFRTWLAARYGDLDALTAAGDRTAAAADIHRARQANDEAGRRQGSGAVLGPATLAHTGHRARPDRAHCGPAGPDD